MNAARGGNLDYSALAFETNAGRVTLTQPVQPVSSAIFVGHDGAPWLYDADSGLLIDARNTAHSNGRIHTSLTPNIEY